MSHEWMTAGGTEISLADLAGELRVHYAAVRDWTTVGRHGVKLRVCRLSRGLGTSMKEYERFQVRMSEAMETSGP